jgi:hypothetical protein
VECRAVAPLARESTGACSESWSRCRQRSGEQTSAGGRHRGASVSRPRRVGHSRHRGGQCPDSDLSDLDPVFDAIIAVVYVVGAGLLVRNARSGKTWRALLVPFAFFFPVLLISVSLVLLALGGTL